MAKKLSTLVIDATVNTTGIDKAVSSINNKLKNVKGSGGSGGGSRDGRFSAGINPNAYVGGGSGTSAAAAAAFGAAFGGRGQEASRRIRETFGQGVYRNAAVAQMSAGAREALTMMSPFGMGGAIVRRTGALSERIREHHRNAKSMERSAKSASPLAMYDLMEGAKQERIEASRLNRQRRALNIAGTTLGRAGMELQRYKNFAQSNMGGLLGGAGLIGTVRYMTNFRQNTYGQFSDLDQFVNTSMFDAAKGLRTTGFGQRGASRTLSQSLMLGARFNNPNQPSILEKGGMGIQDYYQNMMFGLGAFISNPVDAIGQSLYPGSPMRQALGENPNDLSWFAKMQKSFFDTFTQTRRGSV